MNKYKKLSVNTLIFSIGSFSSKLLSFLLVRFYTEYLTKAETSTFDLVCQTANLLVPIATLSITEGVIRYGLDGNMPKTQIEVATEIDMSQANVSKLEHDALNRLKYALRRCVRND